MAKQVKPQNTGTLGTRSFDKDLIEDVRDYHLPPNSWTHARNAINNSQIGDLGDIGNEASNRFCAAAPYKVIGAIHLEADRWILYSTDEINSEIGEFLEDTCAYRTIVNDPCLAFSDHHLIKGVSKENFDCTWQVYWDDGNNPTRTLNVDDIPFIENCTTDAAGCVTCVPTTALDCDKIRLAPLLKTPCFTVQKGANGGELLNGSYYVVAAYVINEQRISDYFPPSNIQSLFSHRNVSGSIDILVDEIDEDFDDFELVIVSTVNQQTSARRVGIYNTRQRRITIDAIDDRWTSVGIDLIPLRNPVVDKSDAIFENSDYMIRVGPTNKFDFNYQPLANQIDTKWVSVEYPGDYYRKGGNVTGYMRDEVYPFFIRWIYDTGDKTSSFHIPGRVSAPADFAVIANRDAQPEIDDGITAYRWRVYNTAAVTNTAVSALPDGGVKLSEGDMGYWESSEKYDDDTPDVWNASSDPIWGSTSPAHDLCGKQIRHHRFPDNDLHPTTVHYDPTGNDTIRVMGIKFNNIKAPLDNQGNPIPNIVGYEILRGTREGNKSVVAKGMINNMRRYNIEGGITPRGGLYPNYPYNDLRPDEYINIVETTGNGCPNPAPFLPNPFYSQEHFTFHSPDTSFKDPFLSAKIIKMYGELNGTADGQFVEADKHPRHKFVSDLSFIVSLISGFAFSLVAINGERRTKYLGPRTINLGGVWVGTSSGAQPIDFGVSSNLATGGYNAGFSAAIIAGGQAAAQYGTTILGQANEPYYTGFLAAGSGVSAAPGTMGPQFEFEQVDGPLRQLDPVIGILQALPTWSHYLAQGTDETLRLIRSFAKPRQFALQYQSHCHYDRWTGNTIDNVRRPIKEAIYLDPQIQDFGDSHRITNVFRSRTVAIETGGSISPIIDDPIVTDNTRVTVKSAPGAITHKDFDVPFNTTASSHYTGLKQRIRNQYGQIEGIIQVPVTTCPTPTNQTTSDVLFGGDIYIGRYTEKNTMFFFYNWLHDQPDNAEFNYLLNKMLPHPMYWMDTDPFDINEFTRSVVDNPLSPGSWVFPSDKHVFDRAGCAPPNSGLFMVKFAYMYLFNSGARDFYVESEVNVDLRDWGDNDSERHFDPYGYSDLRNIFNSAIIKAGNFLKYDYSLSISRLFNNFISWGNTHERSYDPTVAEDCFDYRPNRVIYSLQQQQELKKDFWKVFLPNNYRDFKSRVTAIKPVNKNGALIMFENESPVQFLGVDQLQTDAGTKITIGDGGLFEQPLQNVLNTDRPYEYGSCQDRLSVVNTASGIFWMSQNQGKIFRISNGIKEISGDDIKWWLAKYLPYQLTEQFPDFELTDNPVAGIGCQAIYDNRNGLVYFCKKDFVVRDDILDVITYTGSGNEFLVNGILTVTLGDPRYFADASWTISYDPKGESWIAYHDWHPNLLLPGKQTFLSILDEGLWVHNSRCDSFCNFYGIDYPFEVEWAVHSIQDVATLRSVEYQMEVYKYDDNCFDRFHVLDHNFDEAVVYNSEQCSGLLRLNISPKNNAPQIVTFPQVNPTFIGILYSKEEQKYRFNQFWDITQDRGEFNPTAERVIWNTEPNGYIRTLNINNLNYNKFETQRKKFRHYKNTIFVRRTVSGNRKMLVALVNNKNLSSPR